MKLRNKKTGEIIELLAKPSFVKRKDDYLQSEVNTFNSLAELNEEWEDCEEPKEYYWYIDDLGNVSIDKLQSSTITMRKNFDNYFETKEEAEKAVAKLKAWKRLKDKGFRFGHWVTVREKKCGKVEFKCDDIWLGFDKAQKFYDDITLLFGGEE